MIIATRLESSHLAANLLGDPSERDVFVYLPPGYDHSDRRYGAAPRRVSGQARRSTRVEPATSGL